MAPVRGAAPSGPGAPRQGEARPVVARPGDAGTPRPRPAEPLLRTLLGAALRRRRRELGRTLTAVAGDARVSIAYLSEVERGRKEPSSEVLVAVARALGWQLADLLTEVVIELRTHAPRTPGRTTDGAACGTDQPVCLTAA